MTQIRCISFDPGTPTTCAIVEKKDNDFSCQQFTDIENDVTIFFRFIADQRRIAFRDNQTCIVAVESLAAYVRSVARVSSLFKIARVIGNIEALVTLEDLPLILLPAVGTRTEQGWRDLLSIPQPRGRLGGTADAIVAKYLEMWVKLPRTNNHVRDAVGLGIAAIGVYERNSKIQASQKRTP